MTPRIAVIDHGAGNLVSIAQGLARVAALVEVVTRPEEMAGANGIVLPGVGATASVMDAVNRLGFADRLREATVPLLGICVGMQVLFEESEEDGAVGLGLLPGRVVRIPEAPMLPHIGWNDVNIEQPDPMLAGMPPAPIFYFVHSYAPVPVRPQTVIGSTTYGSTFVSMVRHDLVAGVQFHPERSGPTGLRLLANFVTDCRERALAA